MQVYSLKNEITQPRRGCIITSNTPGEYTKREINRYRYIRHIQSRAAMRSPRETHNPRFGLQITSLRLLPIPYIIVLYIHIYHTYILYMYWGRWCSVLVLGCVGRVSTILCTHHSILTGLSSNAKARKNKKQKIFFPRERNLPNINVIKKNI